MFVIIFLIVYFSISLLGVIWLPFEIIHIYKLCKDKRSQDRSDSDVT